MRETLQSMLRSASDARIILSEDEDSAIHPFITCFSCVLWNTQNYGWHVLLSLKVFVKL